MTNLEKLIADNKWQDIKDAPRDDIYLGVIEYAPNQFGQPFEAHYSYSKKEHICCYQTEAVPHIPTHFRPLPDDRLAKVCELLVDALWKIADGVPIDLFYPKYMAEIALQQAEEIAGGDER